MAASGSVSAQAQVPERAPVPERVQVQVPERAQAPGSVRALERVPEPLPELPLQPAPQGASRPPCHT